MEKKFKVGDVVVNIDNGQKMTIKNIRGDFYNCQYFIKYNLHEVIIYSSKILSTQDYIRYMKSEKINDIINKIL